MIKRMTMDGSRFAIFASRRVRWMLLAAAGVGLIAGGVWLAVRANSGGSDQERIAAFFAVPTPSSCDGSLAITLGRARFTAFGQGILQPRNGEKLLTIDVSVSALGAASRIVVPDDFRLAEPARSDLEAPVPDAGAAWRDLAAGATGTGPVAFSVPLKLGAAKLIFDDGCTHQEWVVP